MCCAAVSVRWAEPAPGPGAQGQACMLHKVLMYFLNWAVSLVCILLALDTLHGVRCSPPGADLRGAPACMTCLSVHLVPKTLLTITRERKPNVSAVDFGPRSTFIRSEVLYWGASKQT